MRTLFGFFIVLFLKTHAFELPKSRIDNVFSRHNSAQINEIFGSLYQYSCEKSKSAPNRIERSRFSDLSCDIYKARSYTESKRDKKCMYLGWTPLVNHDLSQRSTIVIRNDNVLEEDTSKTMDYRKIPLYFIFLEIIPEKRILSVEKIIHNPTIETKIDVFHMKSHLEYLAEDSNTTLQMVNLKYHDSGRWFFEFFHTIAVSSS